MMRAVAGLAICISGAVLGQSVVAQRFDVASVKPSIADPNSVSGIQTGHGRLNANNVTVRRCIMGAYGVGNAQIAGGPDWLDSDRFEILARAERPTDDDAVLMVMLQDLLAGRFKLAFHRETRSIPAFVLEVTRNGPKLEKAAPGEASTSSSTSNTAAAIDARKTSMDAFARVLARRMELPVINRTELEGIFNFKLQWTPERRGPSENAGEGPSIFTAIQEQLGLRLRSQKAPVEILVIDHVERPTAN